MMDRQILFEKFLNSLQAAPEPPDYLAAEPETIASFDPYQMVAEWIALRHEVKQQGKLLQTSQSQLQKAFEALQSEKEQSHKLRQPNNEQNVDQKALYRDLLTVVDALEQASTHWQEQIKAIALEPLPPVHQPSWQRWLQKLTRSESLPLSATPSAMGLAEVLTSNQQGVDLIQRSLLEILKQRQITPITAQGHAFNPQTMYAVGRQESAAPDNTVIQEVVRGYYWQDQILREAQVIVAVNRGDKNNG